MVKKGYLVTKLRKLSITKKIILLTLILLFVFTGGFVAVSEQPGFCNSCHIMGPYYTSWQESTHAEVNCLDCHLQPGFAGHIRGKINGMAQAIDCAVGRMSTKPSAMVLDMSCLREGCHSVQELEPHDVEYEKFKFTHKNHINTSVDGINITCGTCHSHFEGTEHFSVNTQMCFTCHFLAADQDSERLVETKCESCHNVPEEPAKLGLMEINHTEFVSYEASCEESCHKKQIHVPSMVSDSSCLNCHDYRSAGTANSEELHQQHTIGEHKVECFACHGELNHKSSVGITLTTMLDCQSCHSNTHEVQRAIYTAADEPHEKDQEQILSPMFMTHVKCKGCHIVIEKQNKQKGALNSLGMVAKATPQACDRCHDPGTGEKYIPFWQDQIKQLYEKVNAKVVALEQRSENESSQELAANFADKAIQARLLLDAVVADGSWGVHNLKYTEDMLIKVRNIVTIEE